VARDEKQEQEFKRELQKLFPSFRKEIERMRIRYTTDLIPVIYRDAVGKWFRLNAHTLNWFREYLRKNFRRAWYEDGRTIYVWPGDRRAEFHETVHYLIQMGLRRNYGVRVRLLKYQPPIEMEEGVVKAFEHHYAALREGQSIEDLRDSLRNALNFYSDYYGRRGKKFDVNAYISAYNYALDLIRQYGPDTALKIIVSEYLPSHNPLLVELKKRLNTRSI